jgi:hypothetical protein
VDAERVAALKAAAERLQSNERLQTQLTALHQVCLLHFSPPFCLLSTEERSLYCDCD